MRKTHFLGLSALFLAIAGASGMAQIERLTLNDMVSKSDNAVYGQIVGSHVFRVDHPVEGPELYFTTLTLEGRSLVDGTPIIVDVTYGGGFINDREGVYNSEAPSADDVQIGNDVVVFYKWIDASVAAGNTIYAAHGGLYRTADGPNGITVLGRGDGYAVDANIKLADLDTAITTLSIEKKR